MRSSHFAYSLPSSARSIRTTRINLGKNVSREVYFALMESHLRYGIQFWGFADDQLVHSIFVLQKRAIRYMCAVGPREHCRPLFIRERILTLTSIFILMTVGMVYNKYRGLSNSSTRMTRFNIDNLGLLIPKASLTKHSIIYEGVKMFNHLPLELKKLESGGLFVKHVKRLLLNKAYYSLNEFYCDRL